MLSTGTLALALGAAGYGAATGLLLPRAGGRLTLATEPPEEHHPSPEPELAVSSDAPERDVGEEPTPRGDAGHPEGPCPPDRPDSPEPSDRHAAPYAQSPDDQPSAGASFRTAAGWRHALLTAAVCAAVAAAVGLRPELAVWLLLLPCWLLLAAVDWRTRQLPDALTLPLAGAAPLLLGLAALAPGAAGHWPDALIGELGLAGAYFVLFLIHPDGMGFGDVKLALSLGAALGWYGWPVVALGGFLGLASGAVYGIVGVLLIQRAGRKATMPLGPFMVLGAVLALIIGGLAA